MTTTPVDPRSALEAAVLARRAKQRTRRHVVEERVAVVLSMAMLVLLAIGVANALHLI